MRLTLLALLTVLVTILGAAEGIPERQLQPDWRGVPCQQALNDFAADLAVQVEWDAQTQQRLRQQTMTLTSPKPLPSLSIARAFEASLDLHLSISTGVMRIAPAQDVAERRYELGPLMSPASKLPIPSVVMGQVGPLPQARPVDDDDMDNTIFDLDLLSSFLTDSFDTYDITYVGAAVVVSARARTLELIDAIYADLHAAITERWKCRITIGTSSTGVQRPAGICTPENAAAWRNNLNNSRSYQLSSQYRGSASTRDGANRTLTTQGPKAFSGTTLELGIQAQLLLQPGRGINRIYLDLSWVDLLDITSTTQAETVAELPKTWEWHPQLDLAIPHGMAAVLAVPHNDALAVLVVEVLP
ncbi:MAG: hypothetical protein PF961_08385 [Planctomycetota bacterium]|nr:hypothetical protein [Planctomycetota bacterium]